MTWKMCIHPRDRKRVPSRHLLLIEPRRLVGSRAFGEADLDWSATGDRSTTACRTLEFCGYINESEAPSA